MAEEKKRQTQTLIERTDNLNKIMGHISYLESIGEKIPTDLQDELNNMLTAHADKVDRCVIWINRAKAEIDWLKEEKKSIDAQIKRVENSIKRMNSLASMVMTNTGQTKMTGMHHYFSQRKSQAALIMDEDQIPEDYRCVEVKKTIDKSKILMDLKSGKDVPGAVLDKRINIVSK